MVPGLLRARPFDSALSSIPKHKLVEITVKKTKYVARLPVALSFLLLLALGNTAQADSHAAPPPPAILEAFLCNYNDGKDTDDLMSARDFYLKQAEKAGLTLPPAYVWSLIKGGGQYEVLWFNVHENLKAYGAATDAYAAADMAAADERFDTVASCISNIATVNQFFEREVEPEEGDDTVVVSSSACQFRHGVGAAQVPDLMDHIAGVLGEMGDNTPTGAFMANPITGGGPVQVDRFLFNVNDDMSSWTNFIAGLVNSKAGQRLGRHYNMVFNCTASLWAAQQVVEDAGEE